MGRGEVITCKIGDNWVAKAQWDRLSFGASDGWHQSAARDGDAARSTAAYQGGRTAGQGRADRFDRSDVTLPEMPQQVIGTRRTSGSDPDCDALLAHHLEDALAQFGVSCND